MPSIEQLTQFIKQQSQSPQFQKLTGAQKHEALKGMLNRSEKFASMGQDDQTFHLHRVEESLGLTPAPQPSAGGMLQGAIEHGLPVAASIAAARVGGVAGALGGAGAAGAAGQVGEFTRPYLTDEPMRGLEERAIKMGIDVGGSLVGDVLVAGTAATIQGSKNFVKNAVRRYFRRTASTEAEGAARVFKGARVAPFQVSEPSEEAFGQAIEDIAFNSVTGKSIFNRMQREQLTATSAYLDEMGATIGDNLDAPSLVLFMEAAIDSRRRIGRSMERGLWKKLTNSVPDAQINMSQQFRSLADVAHTGPIRETLEPIMPEAFRAGIAPGAIGKGAAKTARAEAKTAAARAAKLESQLAERRAAGLAPETDPLVREAVTARAEARRLGSIAQAEEAGVATRGAEEFAEEIQIAQGPQMLPLDEALNRLRLLRKQARTVGAGTREDKEAAVNILNRAAGDLERAIESQIPEDATAMWNAARDFTRMKNETLNNRALVSMLKKIHTKDGKADTFFDIALSRSESNSMLALKESLDKPVTMAGKTVPGGNLWDAAVKPRILDSIIRQAQTGSGRTVAEISGDGLAKTLKNMSKTQTDKLLGSGTFDSLRDLSDALIVAQKRPSNTWGMAIRSLQMMAAVDLVAGTAGATLTSEGLGESGLARKAVGGTIILGPHVMARVIANRALTRRLAQAIRNPGKGNILLNKVVARLAVEGAMAEEESVELDDAMALLKESKESSFGFFNFLGR